MKVKQRRSGSLLVNIFLAAGYATILSSCSSPEESTQTVAPVGKPKLTTLSQTGSNTEPQQGFVNLPSPKDVVDAYPKGREDPFAPVDRQNYLPPPRFVYERGSKQAGLSEEQVQEQTKGFHVSGVVRVGGAVSALVINSGVSGSVRVGDQGGKPLTEAQFLLPTGWKVVAISPSSGSVTIERMGTRLTVSAGGG